MNLQCNNQPSREARASDDESATATCSWSQSHENDAVGGGLIRER